MTLWNELERATTSDGDEIILRRNGDIYEIRTNGVELMSSFNHRSEMILAERSLRLHGGAAQRILIGGLGMGFTLRTALDCLNTEAEVIVRELAPEIVSWNMQHMGHLAGHPIHDPRVRVEIGDVMAALDRTEERYDLILMDTDNGPDFTVRETNNAIYSECGLEAVYRSLEPAGIASFWSATISDEFESRLDCLPWTWHRDDINLIGGRADAFHHVYFAQVDPLECLESGHVRERLLSFSG